MAMHDLMDDVSAEAFEPLQAAFRQGYTSLLSWPEAYEGQVDNFRAGRILWKANYIAHFESKYLNQYVTWVTPQLKRYLETGLVRKSPC